MTTTFPPKPWQEGATFTNDTTGVGYTYSGGKWLASGGPKVEGEYVSKKGGDEMEGPFKVTNQAGLDSRAGRRIEALGLFSGTESSALRLGTNGDRVYVGSNDTSFNGLVKLDKLESKSGNAIQFTSDVSFKDASKLQMGGTYNNNIIDEKLGFTDNGYVATLGYVKHQINALGDSVGGEQNTGSFRKYKFANKGFLDLRPGEFCFIDAKNASTNELDLVRGVCFSAVDADGNRAVRDENAISYRTTLGSALNLLNSDGSRLYYRVTTGAALLDYDKELDLYMVFWNASERIEKAGVRTSTFTKCTNSQSITFHCADLFF